MKRGNKIFAPFRRYHGPYDERRPCFEGFNTKRLKPFDVLRDNNLGAVGIFYCGRCAKMIILDLTQPEETDVCLHCGHAINTIALVDGNKLMS